MSRQKWITAATCVAAFLQTEGFTLGAQHFLSEVVNPYGITGLASHPQHAVIDLDNDGDVDFLSFEYGAGDDIELRFRENISSGSTPAFAPVSELPFNLGSLSPDGFVFSTGDLDQDGDIDILAHVGIAEIPVGYSYRFEPIMAFIENIGTPEAANFQFEKLDTLNTSVFNEGIGFPNLVDLDDDGDLDLMMDLLIYNFGSVVDEVHPVYYENIGIESQWRFATGAHEPFNYLFPQGGQYMLHAFGDMDHDGDQDLLAHHSVYDEDLEGFVVRYIYYANAGDPANPFFAPGMDDPFNLPEEMLGTPQVPVLADWDKDGDLDVSSIDYEHINLIYFQNIGTSSVSDNVGEDKFLFDVKSNPADTWFEIALPGRLNTDAFIRIMDIHGRPMLSTQTSENLHRISCENWPAGHYAIQVITEEHTSATIVEVLHR